ncbi:MAG: phospholipase D-like domain-containing protein [Nocardioides sp.]
MRSARWLVGSMLVVLLSALVPPALSVGAEPVPVRDRGAFTPADGVLFSNPGSRDPRQILTHVIKTVRSTPRGEMIRIAVWNFDDRPTADALVQAFRRGVTVQLVVAGSVDSASFRTVAAELNQKKRDVSFAIKCKGACRSSRKVMHSKIFLFSKTGRATHVSMFGSSNLTTPAANRQWNDLVTVSAEPLYDFFVQTFIEYALDTPVARPYVREDIGRYRVYLYPSGPERSPIFDELGLVECSGASGQPGGRTTVRIAVAGWFDAYGEKIARRVRALWDQGCDVKIITTLAGRGVNRTLRSTRGRGPVPIRQLEVDNDGDGIAERYLHMKAIAITGVFDGDRRAKVVLTGSPNWSTTASTSDEILVRMTKTGGLAATYQRWIDSLYASPSAHLRVSPARPVHASRGADPKLSP